MELILIKSIFLQIFISIAIGTPTSVTYVHQIGEFNLGLNSYERGSILNCASQCAQISDCTCIRLSSNKSDICQPLLNDMDANGLKHSGWVYFSLVLPQSIQENVAMKKPASQSSVFEVNGITYTADRAVDGSYNTDTFKLPYLSQTKDESDADTFPWWQVDLKRDHVITMVKILNRKNPADRLHDFEVRVGHKTITIDHNAAHFTLNGLCGSYKGGSIEGGQWVTINCEPCPLAGRYVTIQIVKLCDDCKEKDKNILGLAEVEVYGSPIAINEKEEKKDTKIKGTINKSLKKQSEDGGSDSNAEDDSN